MSAQEIRCPAPECKKGILRPCNDYEYKQFNYSKIPSEEVVVLKNGFLSTILYTHKRDEILVACNCCNHHHPVKKSRLEL